MATVAQTLLNITRVAERAVEWCHAVKVRPTHAVQAAKDLERAINPNGYARDNEPRYRRCALLCPGDWPESIPAQFAAIRRLKDLLDDGGNPETIADAMIPDAAGLLATCRRIWDNEHVSPAFHRELAAAERALRYSVARGEKVRHAYMVAS